MADRVRVRPWMAGLAAATALTLGLVPAGRCHAQATQPIDSPPTYGGEGSFANRLFGGMEKPKVEPQGDWGEVIMANARWVVLQNSQGQQLPLSYDQIRQFVVRWPTRLDLIAADAFLEVTGVDIGSNQVRTNHIDVYEGKDRTMVTPTMLRLFGANRVLTPFDLEQAQLYGTVIPFSPAEMNIPPRVHAVGTVQGLDPLRVGVEGNNWVAVLPAEDGLDMTQVTPGTPTYVKKGDVVYFIPEAANAKSLAVSRLILYKKMTLRAYQN